jgi:hypothetical protein
VSAALPRDSLSVDIDVDHSGRVSCGSLLRNRLSRTTAGRVRAATRHPAAPVGLAEARPWNPRRSASRDFRRFASIRVP